MFDVTVSPCPAIAGTHVGSMRNGERDDSALPANRRVGPREGANAVREQEFAAFMAAVAARRDREAFAALFQYFAPRVKAYLLRGGAAEDAAEDIAQDVMATVWRKAGQFDPAKAALSTWIFRIARNRRIDLLRRERRPAITEAEDAGEPSWIPDHHAAIEAAEASGLLKDAVAGLPPDQREVIAKAFYEDLSHRDVAEALDLPLGTVKSRIRLALAKLNDMLPESLR